MPLLCIATRTPVSVPDPFSLSKLCCCRMQDAQKRLKEEQNLMAEKEEQFEKEIGVAQKLVNLHKSHCDKRTAEAVELESVIRDLRRHIEVQNAFLQVFTLSALVAG